jgi:hypothetical protein
MSALGLIMPIVAAGSLTVALLVPLRDARRGERATLRGGTPVHPSFGSSERTELRGSPRSYAARIHRAIETLGNKVTVMLGLQPRAAATTTVGDDRDHVDANVESSDSFADRVAYLVSDPTPAEITSPTIEYDVAGAGLDVSVATETGEANADEVNPTASDCRPLATSAPSLQRTQATEGVTRLARDLPPPLTRLRLRPDSGAISWPMHLPIPHLGMNDHERRDILAGLERTADASHERALARAYREEDALGRMMALRALSHISTQTSHAILTDALNLGSDDERALAVDLLSGSDDREALVFALQDRLDAIAARAALAYVRSNRRSDFERLLASHVDEPRLESILALLGGILE